MNQNCTRYCDRHIESVSEVSDQTDRGSITNKKIKIKVDERRKITFKLATYYGMQVQEQNNVDIN